MSIGKKKKIITISIILTSIILSFVGGQSYARYAKDVRGDVIAQIATWDFKVNGQSQEVHTINMKSQLPNGKIAPGTNGKFDIIIDATGTEVGVGYNIKFLNETDKPRNLKFIYEDKIYNSITELDQILSDTISMDNENKTKVITINWEWKFETGNTDKEIYQNDLIDTQDMKSISNYSFQIIVSGTQL